MQIEEYRIHLERFEASLNRELYQFYSGHKDFPQVSSVYSEYSDLYSRDTLREIDSEIERIPEALSSRRKSLEKIRCFATQHRLEAACAQCAEEIARRESAGSATWKGREIPSAQIASHLANETDPSERRRLEVLRRDLLAQVDPLRRQLLEAQHDESVKLGFGSYLGARQYISGIDYRRLSTEFERALEDSTQEYLSCLERSLLNSLNLPLSGAQDCDVPSWISANEARAPFRQDLLLPALSATLSGLAIEPERREAIKLERELRPRGPSGAFCIPIGIPDQVVIVASAQQGCQGYADLLHESGHAHHFAWTSPTLAAEHRLYGDRGLAELYGFLFEHLLWNDAWLQEMLGYLSSHEFLRFQALHRAYTVRYHLGLLVYEIQLYAGKGCSGAPERYAECLKARTAIEHAPEAYLENWAQSLSSADYLRAWICEAMMHEHIRTKWGTAWFREKAAGRFFKELWETGQLYSLDQLCSELGLGELNPEALTDQLREGLRS